MRAEPRRAGVVYRAVSVATCQRQVARLSVRGRPIAAAAHTIFAIGPSHHSGRGREMSQLKSV